jgi:hypothetical protein
VVSSNETAFFDLGADKRHTVFVECVAPFGFDLTSRGKSEELGDCVPGFGASGVLFIKSMDFGLVDRTVPEAAFVG